MRAGAEGAAGTARKEKGMMERSTLLAVRHEGWLGRRD